VLITQSSAAHQNRGKYNEKKIPLFYLSGSVPRNQLKVNVFTSERQITRESETSTKTLKNINRNIKKHKKNIENHKKNIEKH
jgi:hypothetical protein